MTVAINNNTKSLARKSSFRLPKRKLGGLGGGGLLEVDGDVGDAADGAATDLALVEALVGSSSRGGAGGDDGDAAGEGHTRGEGDARRQGDGDLGRDRGEESGDDNSEELHFGEWKLLKTRVV